MKRNIKLGNTTYTSTSKGLRDKENTILLHALETVVDSVAEVFGSNCEVVLHSLEDLGHTVVKIANGQVTGRKAGSPMTDFGIEILEEAMLSGKDAAGSYYNRLDNGKLLKSSSAVIRNGKGEFVGMLCINVDLSVPLLDFARELLPEKGEFPERVVEHFPSTLDELVERTLEEVMSQVGNQREVAPVEKNKAIITELYRRGIFKVAGVIDILAKKMGISRYTVYHYIRDAKVK